MGISSLNLSRLFNLKFSFNLFNRVRLNQTKQIKIKHADPGFSLMELLVATAIAGIITGFAVPAYTQYVNKTKVMEGVITANSLKLNVSNYTLEQPNSAEITGASNQAVGARQPSQFKSGAVQNILIQNNGTITVNYTKDLGVLNFIPTIDPTSHQMSWSCEYPLNSPMKKYAPNGCNPSSQSN